MILIKYLHIGIDDTDSPDGMCTTYLACHIIDKLKEVGIEIVGCPRLIRLNPFARFKTRGNGGVAFKILNDDKSDLYPIVECITIVSKIIFVNSKKYHILD